MIEIRRYVIGSGRDTVGEWLANLNDARARAKINARIERLAVGNFGDSKRLRAGVSELRIDYGPGYRVYFAMISETVVALPCAGDKRRQSADIRRATAMLQDFRRRMP